ncbi:hypothetical protein B0H14DRAFT_3862649 [Mycena olivaceomarginata]|nr:hypothetical protein B0H14DRAFT_3862649 [Mycena olivaceomarginata]
MGATTRNTMISRSRTRRTFRMSQQMFCHGRSRKSRRAGRMMMASMLNDNLGHERPSSRASMSSGYMSVPASEPADDSDESDAEASATFAALSKAAQRVPLAEQSKKKSAENTASVDEPSCLPPRKERGKRDTARDNEKRRSIDSDTATSTKPQGLGKLRDNSSAPKHVGKERQSSPDIISISDSDDDAVQVVDSSSIEIVFRPEDGKVTP